MLDPEFIEWLSEGTREEVYEKNRKFIKYLREHPEIYVGKQEWLDSKEKPTKKQSGFSQSKKPRVVIPLSVRNINLPEIIN